MTRIPVLIPGLLGSTLVDRESGITLWGRDIVENIKALGRKNDMLKWDERTAHSQFIQAEFIETFDVGRLKPFDIWSRCIELLKSVDDVAPCEAWIRFGYDWRRSVEYSAALLCAKLANRLGVEPALLSEIPPSNVSDRILFVSHSMGGLVVKAAIGSGKLHPAWLDCIVQIGAPLQGTPEALRAAFDPRAWPFRPALFLRAWGPSMVVRRTAIRRIQKAARTFDSTYELMPPPPISYAYQDKDIASERFNPLFHSSTKFKPRERELLMHLERLLQEADKILSKNKNVQLYSIYSSGRSTPFRLKVDLERSPLRVVHPTKLPYGDGTIPSYSARGSGCISIPVQNVAHEELCTSSIVLKHVRDYVGEL